MRTRIAVRTANTTAFFLIVQIIVFLLCVEIKPREVAVFVFRELWFPALIEGSNDYTEFEVCNEVLCYIKVNIYHAPILFD